MQSKWQNQMQISSTNLTWWMILVFVSIITSGIISVEMPVMLTVSGSSSYLCWPCLWDHWLDAKPALYSTMYVKLASSPTSRASPVSAHILSKKHWDYRCALLWPSFHGSQGFKLRFSRLCSTHRTRSPVPESFSLLLCFLDLELPEDSSCVWLISSDPSGSRDGRTVVIHADQQGSHRLGGP